MLIGIAFPYFYFSLSNPMLLFAIVFCLAGWWYVSIKNHGQNVTIFGMISSVCLSIFHIVILIVGIFEYF